MHILDRRFSLSVFTLLAVLGFSLLFLMVGGLAQAQDTTIEYAENGKDPVATFNATDPEGETPVEWFIQLTALSHVCRSGFTAASGFRRRRRLRHRQEDRRPDVRRRG